MAISVYPAAKVDNWVQIATTTPTSGTVISFTSIPSGYRKLWLVSGNNPITLSNGANLNITLNSITASNSYTYFNSTFTAPASYTAGTSISQSITTTSLVFNLFFENKTSAIPSASFTGSLGAGSNARTVYQGRVPALTTEITRIDLTLTAGAINSTNGTLELYGTY